jgi:hypothetical protein
MITNIHYLGMTKSLSNKYLLFLFLILIAACNSSNLQDEIILKANDNVITEAEFKYLKDFAGKNPKYHKYSDSNELYNYIVNVLANTHKTATVWNPKPIVREIPFNVNVYIENSESMDGYVNENDFKNDVYELLGNVKSLSDSLNLNFINSQPHNIKTNANSSDNKAFILNLTKAQFIKNGGDRDISDMSEILKMVLQKTNNRNLSVLISDFVFSPGSGVDAEKYLDIQKLSIRDIFSDKLKSQDLALAVYQMKASFNGKYFDHNNRGLPYNGLRPYYIWIIGKQDQVEMLISNQVVRKANNYLNSIIYSNSKSATPLNFKIVKNGHSGDFKSSSIKNEINNASLGNDGFEFSTAVDFSKYLKDENYFLDAKNFLVNDTSFKISIRLLTDVERQSPSLKGFTHLISFKTNKLVSEDLNVKILSKQPSWITDNNSMSDSNLQANKSEQSKTFGLKYLLDGVNDAFNPIPDEDKNIISEFTLKLKVKL